VNFIFPSFADGSLDLSSLQLRQHDVASLKWILHNAEFAHEATAAEILLLVSRAVERTTQWLTRREQKGGPTTGNPLAQ
jgi:hypothetical protein